MKSKRVSAKKFTGGPEEEGEAVHCSCGNPNNNSWNSRSRKEIKKRKLRDQDSDLKNKVGSVMKRRRVSSMPATSSSLPVNKPTGCAEQVVNSCLGKKTASLSKSRSKTKTKTRTIKDIYNDRGSNGINNILGTPIPVGDGHRNLTWRLVNTRLISESYYEAKLWSALDVIHECFEPSKDPYTGRDVSQDIVFDLESDSELNLRGFNTVILENHEDVICVATVRINPIANVAELPLVATREKYRGLGMCRILMTELEERLVQFGIQRLVLPSTQGALKTWTKCSFGFSEMTDAEISQLSDSHCFLDFKDTVMCHKLLFIS